MPLTVSDHREIEKVPMKYSDPGNIEAAIRGELLSKASSELGYVGETFGALGPLAKVLEDLQIPVLNKDMVKQYQSKKERTWTVPYAAIGHITASAGIPFALFLIWGIISNFMGWHETNSFTMIDGTGITTGLLSLVSIIAGNMFVHESISSKKYTWYWRLFSLGKSTAQMENMLPYERHSSRSVPQYTRYVPFHVLNKALQVKAALPNVGIGVEELTFKAEDIPKPEPDPFLFVELNGEMYYIEAWDEREFEAKA